MSCNRLRKHHVVHCFKSDIMCAGAFHPNDRRLRDDDRRRAGSRHFHRAGRYKYPEYSTLFVLILLIVFYTILSSWSYFHASELFRGNVLGRGRPYQPNVLARSSGSEPCHLPPEPRLKQPLLDNKIKIPLTTEILTAIKSNASFFSYQLQNFHKHIFGTQVAGAGGARLACDHFTTAGILITSFKLQWRD
jgi:hypothetical protein